MNTTQKTEKNLNDIIKDTYYSIDQSFDDRLNLFYEFNCYLADIKNIVYSFTELFYSYFNDIPLWFIININHEKGLIFEKSYKLQNNNELYLTITIDNNANFYFYFYELTEQPNQIRHNVIDFSFSTTNMHEFMQVLSVHWNKNKLQFKK